MSNKEGFSALRKMSDRMMCGVLPFRARGRCTEPAIDCGNGDWVMVVSVERKRGRCVMRDAKRDLDDVVWSRQSSLAVSFGCGGSDRYKESGRGYYINGIANLSACRPPLVLR